ncbi:Probable D%2CD-dipeptide transport system permease protein ddpC [uncultured Clostridium sp.]|nr:Probable D%2CD-dipeptide transport system permease protein ddpC [uncultured Clostridium sp.]
MKQIRRYLVVLCLLAAISLYGLTAYPHSPVRSSGGSLEPPSAVHLLGTDNLGIDIFAQLSKGFYLSMATGVTTAACSFAVGGTLGIWSGYCGKRADAVISFITNVFLAVPQLPIMIVIGAFWGQSIWNIILIISAFSWASIAKQVRAKVKSVKNRKYVVLAESFGASPWYIVRTHMMGEVLPLLSVNSIAVTGKTIIQESSLAYLGLSDPLAKSWGLMIQNASSFTGIYFTDYWKWWLIPPVMMLVITILSLRLLAHGLEQRMIEEK